MNVEDYEAAAESLEAIIAERDEALELLLEAVRDECLVASFAGPAFDHLDSMARSTWADALRLLARSGRVRIVSESGRRVIAKLVEESGHG